MTDEWLDADSKTKTTAEKIFELIQSEKLSVSQFQTLLKILPDIVFQNTTIKK